MHNTMACSISALEDGNSQTVASYISMSEPVWLLFSGGTERQSI